jgi:hypothetical protein
MADIALVLIGISAVSAGVSSFFLMEMVIRLRKRVIALEHVVYLHDMKLYSGDVYAED